MADPLRSLLRRARREASGRSLLAGVAVGCAIAAVLVPAGSIFTNFPRSCVALLAVPVAAIVALARRPPTDLAIARALDDRFATGELLATALAVDDDAAGGSIVIEQADALARRLADADLRDGRPTRRLAAAGVALALSITIAGGVAPTPRRPDVAHAPPNASSFEGADRSIADGRAAPARSPRAGDAESADASRATAGADAAARDAGRSPADGVGAARSPLAPASPTSLARSRASESTTDGPPAAGGDGAASTPAAGDAVAGGTARRDALAVADDAIDSPSDAARGAIDAGRVPAASRALVRAFFDPDDAGR